MWVEPPPPKFFCEFLDMLTNVDKYLFDMLLPAPWYGDIAKIYDTCLGQQHNPDRLTHIYWYMDDITMET